MSRAARSVLVWIFLTGAGLAVVRAEAAASAADSAQPEAIRVHLEQLRARVPEGFTLVMTPPFVVLGNEAPEVVHQRASKTVQWAVNKLKQDYFATDPKEVIDVWLFRDRTSYTNYARILFHDTPTTPLGYTFFLARFSFGLQSHALAR